MQNKEEEASVEADKAPSLRSEHPSVAEEPASGTGGAVPVDPPAADEAQPQPQPQPQRPTTSSSWLSWFARTPAPALIQPDQIEEMPPTDAKNAQNGRIAQDEEPSKSADQPSSPDEPNAAESTDESSKTGGQEPGLGGEAEATKPSTSVNSWFGLWSSRPTAPADPPVETAESLQQAEASSVPKTDEDVDMSDAPASQSKAEPAKPPSAGSTWAFWSRDTRPSDTQTSKQRVEPGELAVFGQGSESHPEPVNSSEVNDPRSKPGGQVKQRPATPVSVPASNKRARPDSMDIDTSAPGTPKSDKQGKPAKGVKSDAAPKPEVAQAETPTKAKAPAKDTTGATLPPNLLLPSFEGTYSMKENPSIIRQIADFLLRTRQAPANHVYRVKEPPRIKKALAIGIHGLFPASYLKPIIGQPTGTSLRFANFAAEAIRRWADDNEQEDCEIEKVALEGEGKIFDRVNNLWTLLLNWIDHIRQADLIILACHSQGVPVTIILLAKLIDLGIVTNAKIGVCSMG